MQIKKIIFLSFTFFFILSICQESLAQREARSRKGKAVTKSRQIQTVSVDKDSATGETTVQTLLLPAKITPQQVLKVGALFTTESPDKITLFIVSFANDYQYAGNSYLSILVDGENLLDKYYQASRTTGVENGLAVEYLSVRLDFSDFERIINANRVDISPNFRPFTLGFENKNTLNDFYQKLSPIAETAKLKKQDLEFERAARRKALEEEQGKKQEKEAEEKKAAEVAEYEMKRCKLTLDQSPEIRGLRLGMNKTQVMPSFKRDYNSSQDYFINFCVIHNDSFSKELLKRTPDFSPTLYDGIYNFDLYFAGNTLVRYKIDYEDEMTKWKNTEQFIDDLSKYLTLPKYWHIFKLSENIYSAECDGWNIKISKGIIDISKPGVVRRGEIDESCQKLKDSQNLDKQKKVFKP
jgi:hypothetical protein